MLAAAAFYGRARREFRRFFLFVMKGRIVHDNEALRPERGQQHFLDPCYCQIGAAFLDQHGQRDPIFAPLCHDEIRETLRNLFDRARKEGILPPLSPKDRPLSDPIEAMIALRNGLSHGTADLHLPAMAVNVVEACACVIGIIYPG